MKRENIRLRIRLSDVESQLLQMETDSDTATNRRISIRLKQERQRQLMKEKETIQESLNLIIYPILGIPVEITSEIFLHCLPVDAARPNANLAPMLLGRICRIWRQIAYNNPRLWAAMRISYWDGNQARLSLVAENWLRRAGSVPLSLNLMLPFTHCSFFSSFHCPCPCRCPSSSIFTDHWGHLTSFSGSCFTLAECADLLLRAPRLIRCEFLFILRSVLPIRTERTLLADLEHLALDTSSPLDTQILDLLTLPRLRSFRLVSLSDHRIDDTPLLSFLQRAPNIQTFRAQLGGLSREVIIAILDEMPALCSLKLQPLCSSATIVFDILRLLNETIAFLPRIQKLSFFVGQTVSWEDRWTPILVDALSSRWEAKSGIAQLVDFEFQFAMDHVAELDANISDCVLKLREKGMRIHVGPHRSG